MENIGQINYKITVDSKQLDQAKLKIKTFSTLLNKMNTHLTKLTKSSKDYRKILQDTSKDLGENTSKIHANEKSFKKIKNNLIKITSLGNSYNKVLQDNSKYLKNNTIIENTSSNTSKNKVKQLLKEKEVLAQQKEPLEINQRLKDRLSRQEKKLTNSIFSTNKKLRKFISHSRLLNMRLSNLKKRIGALSAVFSSFGAIMGVVVIRQLLRLAQTILFVGSKFEFMKRRVLVTNRRIRGSTIKAFGDLKRIGRSTGISLSTILQLYQNIGIASSDLGKSKDEVLSLVKTLSQLAVVGQTSPENMKFGLRQLAQAFSTVIVRAEEFNSLLENLPFLVDALSQVTGKTRGEMLYQVKAGALTSKELANNLIKASLIAQNQMARMGVSLVGRLQSLKDSLGSLIATVLEGTGINGLIRNILRLITMVTGALDKVLTKLFSIRDTLTNITKKISKIIPNILNFSATKTSSNLVKKLFGNFHVNNQELKIWLANLLKIPRIYKRIGEQKQKIEKGVLLKSGIKIKDFFLKTKKDQDNYGPWGKLAEEEIKNFNSLINKFGDPELLETEKFKKRMGLLNKALADTSNSEFKKLADLYKLKERLTKNHHETLLNIKKESKKKEQNLTNKEKFQSFFGIDPEQEKKTFSQLATMQGKKLAQMAGNFAQYSKEMFYLNKALALANATVSGAEAIVGAISVGAKVGPAYTNALIGLTATATSLEIATILGTTFKGGRASGGAVHSGGMYSVNERGPELLTVGNKDFLMMGQNSGHVTSHNNIEKTNRKEVVVNVYDNGENKTTINNRVNRTQNIIDIIIDKIEGNFVSGILDGGSVYSEVLENKYGLNRTGSY